VQTPPAQQIAPPAPHGVHWLVDLLHASPSLHQAPPVPGQHGSPSPPQPVHTLPEQAENGAVQPTPAGQHACPIPPHVPLLHEPFRQWPCAPPHALPDETHVPEVWSQHAPAPHQSPSQQSWPAPPHDAHWPVVWLHASPGAVQKFADTPTPPGEPAQHVSPALPQPPHEALPHVPSIDEPQFWPVSMQSPSTQQRSAAHVALWQQGWLPLPHATRMPSMHTVGAPVGDSPRAAQVPPEQQPPPVHVLPGQQA
jgi:hypothetical protein